jgi:hypothetical protein
MQKQHRVSPVLIRSDPKIKVSKLVTGICPSARMKICSTQASSNSTPSDIIQRALYISMANDSRIDMT